MTRREQVVSAVGTIRDARRALARAERALEDILFRERGRDLSAIDARDEAMDYVRGAAALVAPLEDAIGNLPGIDPWEDA